MLKPSLKILLIVAGVLGIMTLVIKLYQVQARGQGCWQDFSQDGKIGTDEYLYVLTHWGETCESFPGPTPIPPQCGNGICEVNESVPCPSGSQCIWAGSCPQDCKLGAECVAEANCGTGMACVADPCPKTSTQRCQSHCQTITGASAECTVNGGSYLPQFHECEGISADVCAQLDGKYESCASACRHHPDYPSVICTEQCVGVCILPPGSQDLDNQ